MERQNCRKLAKRSILSRGEEQEALGRVLRRLVDFQRSSLLGSREKRANAENRTFSIGG